MPELKGIEGGNSDIVKEILQVNALIADELKEWEKNDIHPSSVGVDEFLLDQYIHSMAAFLVEKGIIDDHEFTLFFKERLLAKLTEIRPQILETIEQIKTRSKIVLPGNEPVQ